MEKERFIFDIDGTLLEADYSYEREYFMSVLCKDAAERFIPMIEKLIKEYEKKYTKYDISLLSKYLTCESGVMISEDMIIGWQHALSATTPIVIDGVVDTLEYLKHNDKSLAILTRWFLEPQIVRLEKSGLKDYFDDFFGGETYIKPNRQGYINACGRYPVESCVMIGDSLEADIYGAMEIGLDSIYYNKMGDDNFDKSKIKSIGNMRMIKEMF